MKSHTKNYENFTLNGNVPLNKCLFFVFQSGTLLCYLINGDWDRFYVFDNSSKACEFVVITYMAVAIEMK